VLVIKIDLDGVLFDIHDYIEKEVRKIYPKYSQSKILTYDFNKSLKDKLSSGGKDSLEIWKIICENDITKETPLIKEMLGNVETFEKCRLDEKMVQMIKELLTMKDIKVIFHSI
jgi:hypothetical protein